MLFEVLVSTSALDPARIRLLQLVQLVGCSFDLLHEHVVGVLVWCNVKGRLCDFYRCHLLLFKFYIFVSDWRDLFLFDLLFELDKFLKEVCVHCVFSLPLFEGLFLLDFVTILIFGSLNLKPLFCYGTNLPFGFVMPHGKYCACIFCMVLCLKLVSRHSVLSFNCP